MLHRLKPSQYAVFIAVMLTALAGNTLLAPATAQVGAAQHHHLVPSVQVPFIGCKADGQIGPLKAPKGRSKAVSIPAESAQRLAYYKGEEGPGVLAPRGWNCFEAYGSSGNALYVSPDPINSSIFFSRQWHGFRGPAIELSISIGDTSGRFEVAAIIARVFPSQMVFVRDVINEGIVPATDFPLGPYPKDKLIYKGKNLVEYETPAQTEGLGTRSHLQANANPISGVEILLEGGPSLEALAIRLPPDMKDLTATIIHQVERER